MKLIDLKGKRFGRLKVLRRLPLYKRVMWLCRCNCKGLKIVGTDSLRIGYTTSCGCLRSPNLKGEKRGKLKVLSLVKKRDKNGKKLWNCRCLCGRKIKVTAGRLMSGKQKSCQHCRKEFTDLTGKKIGKLQILALSNRKTASGSKVWDCECDCGGPKRLISVNSGALISGNTRSCGCLHEEEGLLSRLPPEVTGARRLLAQYRYGARKRNIAFNLNEKIFRVLTKLNCFYCGKSPSQKSQVSRRPGVNTEYAPYFYNGIDRLDSKSKKGYDALNVVAACGLCNVGKMSKTIDEFAEQAERLYRHWAKDYFDHPQREIKEIDVCLLRKPSWAKTLYGKSKRGAKLRNVEFDLELAYFENLINQDCFYCGAKPANKYQEKYKNGKYSTPYLHNGLDRIDSSLGYIKSNVCPSCVSCNRIKNDITQAEFAQLIVDIHNHWSGSHKPTQMELPCYTAVQVQDEVSYPPQKSSVAV